MILLISITSVNRNHFTKKIRDVLFLYRSDNEWSQDNIIQRMCQQLNKTHFCPHSGSNCIHNYVLQFVFRKKYSEKNKALHSQKIIHQKLIYIMKNIYEFMKSMPCVKVFDSQRWMLDLQSISVVVRKQMISFNVFDWKKLFWIRKL